MIHAASRGAGTSLDDWIVRTLALPYYSGRPEIPRTLLAHGLLLPVLDGLDEIPKSARRSAVRGINLALGTERPVVVTCRAAEYEDLIRGGTPTLRAAPVVNRAHKGRAELWTVSGTQAQWPDMRDRSTTCIVALSPTSPLIATSDDHDLRLWRYAEGNLVVPLHTLTGHTRAITAVRFSPNGALIATASADRTVRLWRTDRWLPRWLP
ncbi:hypothetical protein [Streptomyces sp. NPDC046942]|uniref:WD40 repeat domain-containing protein n=1 Tax=Streptomyces sp. NPDC046942 TaxID=3155137 RepID=UPI0033FC7CC6